MQITECAPLLRTMGAKIGSTNEADWQELLICFALDGLKHGIARTKVATRCVQVSVEQVADELGHKMGKAKPRPVKPPTLLTQQGYEPTIAAAAPATIKAMSPTARDANAEAYKLISEARVKLEIAEALLRPSGDAQPAAGSIADAIDTPGIRKVQEPKLVKVSRGKDWLGMSDLTTSGKVSAQSAYRTLREHPGWFEQQKRGRLLFIRYKGPAA